MLIIRDHKKLIAASLLWLVALGMWVPRFTQLQIPDAYEEGILACYPDYYEGPAGADKLELNAEADAYRTSFLDGMASSDSGNENVVAAVLTAKNSNYQALTASLDTLVVEHPDNSLAAIHLLSACSKNIEQAVCTQDVVDHAIAMDGDNAVMWSLVSVYRAERDDDYGAMTALRQASIAPEYNDYFSDQLQIMQDAIPPGTKFNVGYLRMQLVDFGTQLFFNNIQTMTRLCGDSAGDRRDLAEACLNFGERVYRQSGSLLMSMIGRAIQGIAYRQMGNDAEADRIDAGSNIHPLSELTSYSSKAIERAQNLSTYDISLSEYWLDNFIEQGEIEAFKKWVEEARRRSSDPDYAPCHRIGLRFDFPYFYVGEQRVIY